MEGRLESALSLARDQKAHLSCYQILPIPYVLWSGEASGMNYGLMLRDAEGAAKDLRTETEATLSKEGVPWDWHVRTGDPVREIILAARLADMIIVGSGSEDDAPPLHIAADLSFHVPIPVLAIPINGAPLDPSGPMVIAWNGSAEAANALRNSLPLISSASSYRSRHQRGLHCHGCLWPFANTRNDIRRRYPAHAGQQRNSSAFVSLRTAETKGLTEYLLYLTWRC